MAIQVVQVSAPATASTNSLTTSFANTVTPGNGIVVVTGSNNTAGIATGVTDGGDTFTKRMEQGSAGSAVIVDGFSTDSSIGGMKNIVCAFTGSSTVFAIAWEVLGTLTFDINNNNTGNNSNQPTGSITTGGAQRVVFVVDRSAGNLSSQPAGYTLDYNNASFMAGYQVFTTVQSAINPAFTAGASVLFSAGIMSFASSITSVPGPPSPRRTYFPPLGPWPLGIPFVQQVRVFPPSPAVDTNIPPGLLPPAFLPISVSIGLFKRPPAPITPPQPPPPPPPPPPPDTTRIKAQILLARRPQPGETEERRLARIADVLSVFFNSLARQNQIVLTGNSEYTLRPVAIEEPRDPTASDDVTARITSGTIWINTATGTGFMCVSNAKAAAVWKQVTV